MLSLAHAEPDMQMAAPQINAMQLGGVDAEPLNRDQLRALTLLLNFRDDARYPIREATFQARVSTGRHEAVAWGYGQNCAVNRFLIQDGVFKGLI